MQCSKNKSDILNLGDFCFEECYSLEYIKFPSTLKKIGVNLLHNVRSHVQIELCEDFDYRSFIPEFFWKNMKFYVYYYKHKTEN